MQFRYQALNAAGQREKGIIDADSPRQARQLLRDRALQPLTLQPRRTGRPVQPVIKGRDAVLLIRQLATLAGASLPLEQTLYALEQQSERLPQRRLLQGLRQKVLEGSALSEAVKHYPKTFPPLYHAMIAAGEASGQLAQVLEQLADYSENSQQLKSKLTQSMIYPLLLTSVALCVVMILLTAVVPNVIAQFTHLQQTLPTTTRVLMALSAGAQRWGPALLASATVAVLVSRLRLRQPASRFRWHQRQLRLPVIGRVARDLHLARYARTLSILTRSAVPLLEGMHISAAVLSNDYVRQRLQQARERVREGATLSQALGETRLLSPMMQHMIASGERSGELDSMLTRAADVQDRAFVGQMTLAVGLFEPLLIVVMAGVVLFIILAILQPILQLNSLI